MPEYTHQFTILGEGESAMSAFENVEVSARGAAEGMEYITQGAYSVNSAFQFVKQGAAMTSAEVGDFAGKLDVLNAAGIRTTQQIRDQIEALDLLKQAHSEDAYVVQELTNRQERLAMQVKRVGRNGARANNVMFSMGYIMNDSAQFTFGFAEGVRALANNIGPLMQNLSYMKGGLSSLLGSLTGVGGLVLAINAITTATVLWGKRTNDASSELENASDKVDDYASSLKNLIELQEESRRLAPVSASDLELQTNVLQNQVRLAEERLAHNKEMLEVTRAVGISMSATRGVSQRRLEDEKNILEQIEEENGLIEETQTQLDTINEILDARNRKEKAYQDLIGMGFQEYRTLIDRVQGLDFSDLGVDELQAAIGGLSDTDFPGFSPEMMQLNKALLGEMNTELERQQSIQRQVNILRMQGQNILADMLEELIKPETEQEEESLNVIQEQRKELRKIQGIHRLLTGDLEGLTGENLNLLVSLEDQTRELEEHVEFAKLLRRHKEKLAGGWFPDIEFTRDHFMSIFGEIGQSQESVMKEAGERMKQNAEGVLKMYGHEEGPISSDQLQGLDAVNQALQDQQNNLSDLEVHWTGYVTNFARDTHAIASAANIAFGGFADLAHSAFEGAEGAARGYWGFFKGFAIAEALANTWVGATKALAQGGPLGYVQAAGIVASGMARVNQIRNLEPGRSSAGGGGGGGGGQQFFYNSNFASGYYNTEGEFPTGEMDFQGQGAFGGPGRDTMGKLARGVDKLVNDGIPVRGELASSPGVLLRANVEDSYRESVLG